MGQSAKDLAYEGAGSAKKRGKRAHRIHFFTALSFKWKPMFRIRIRSCLSFDLYSKDEFFEYRSS
jgi:hypothetical protein